MSACASTPKPRLNGGCEPSKFLTAAKKRAWRAFKEELLWLVESDRAMVDLAATMRAQFAGSRGDVTLNTLQVYSAVLSKLAATPVDRSRVSWAPADGDDDGEFFGPCG